MIDRTGPQLEDAGGVLRGGPAGAEDGLAREGRKRTAMIGTAR